MSTRSIDRCRPDCSASVLDVGGANGRDGGRVMAGAVSGDRGIAMRGAGAVSRDRTMCEAMARLGAFEGAVARAAREASVTGATRAEGARAGGGVVADVLVLGADRREGTAPRGTATVFEGVREAAAREGVDTVRVLCVGPNVKVDDGVDVGTAYAHEAATETKAALEVEYRVGLYHDVVEQGERCADVAFAFNAGVWGYDPSDWMPTVERVVVEEKTPLVVTSYSLREAESDEDALRESLSSFERVEWEWEAEKNSSRSVEVRELGFDGRVYTEDKNFEPLRENSAWMCVTSC